jgi:hypothetical protein
MLRTVQQSRVALAVNLPVIVASLVVFTVPVTRLQVWMQSSPMTMDEARSITHDFVAKMDPSIAGNPANPSIYFTFSGPVPDFDIGIEFFRRYGSIPAGLTESYTVDRNIIDSELSNYAYVVMYSDGSQLPAFVESNRNLTRFQEEIKANWNLQEISRLPYGNADYILYRVVSKKAA